MGQPFLHETFAPQYELVVQIYPRLLFGTVPFATVLLAEELVYPVDYGLLNLDIVPRLS